MKAAVASGKPSRVPGHGFRRFSDGRLTQQTREHGGDSDRSKITVRSFVNNHLGAMFFRSRGADDRINLQLTLLTLAFRLARR